MINTLLEDLLSSSPTLAAPPPWGELEQIDDTVARVAERLQTAPWLLPRLLPSLVVLARKRSARWRSWLEAGEACSVAELKSRFFSPSQGHPHQETAASPGDTLSADTLLPVGSIPIADPTTPAEAPPEQESSAAFDGGFVGLREADLAPQLSSMQGMEEPEWAEAALAQGSPSVGGAEGPAQDFFAQGPAKISLPAGALAREASCEPGPSAVGVPPCADEVCEPAAILEPSLAAEVSPEPPEALPIVAEDLVSAAVGQEQIKAFAQHFGKRRFSSSLVHERDPRLCQREDLVRHILERLGPLPDKLDIRQAGAWKDRLEELTDERRLQQWLVLDKPLQVDLLTLMVALTRAVQEAGGPLYEPRKVFARLSAYSQREQPGFTHGMARQHKPAHGSWLADAAQALGALRRWLGEGTPASSKPSPTPPAPPVAPAATLAANEEPEEDPGLDALVEEGWPCWPQVRAMRAILVGGVPKERCRQRLAEAFQLASLDWVDGDVRRVDSATARIQHGGLDLVLVVRDFISHKASRKLARACKNHKIPCVLVEHGHGVLAVRRSLERCLPTTS